MNNLPILSTILCIVAITSCQFLERSKSIGLSCDQCEGSECDISIEECKYGAFKNYCGRLECKKGLNQTCGGKFHNLGKCADSLLCSPCNVCTGCTEAGECYETNCHMEYNQILPIIGRPGRPMRNPYAVPLPLFKAFD